MRNLIAACRCQLHHAHPTSYQMFVRKGYGPRACIAGDNRFHKQYSHSAHPNIIPLAKLLKQVWLLGGMVHSQRQFHLTSSVQAQVIHQQLQVSVDEAKIRNVLKANNISFELGFTCFIMDCIFCKHKKAGRKSDSEKMYVNMITGSFMCHQCGRGGTWSQLEDQLSMLYSPKGKRVRLPPPPPPAAPPPSVTRLWEAAQPVEAADADTLQAALERLNLQGIGADTLRRFEARVRGRDHALLTSRLCDALALSERSRGPVLALPHGTSSLPTELLPLLERFTKLTFWFPGDVVSWNAVRCFARKLSEKRCFTVRPSAEHGSPLEAMRAGASLQRILEAAAPLYHNAITTFSALRQDVFEEISNATQVAGVQWKRFPGLNRLLRGHRRGELTILSGPTGAGKTTFVSEYSLDLSMQGVNTLWGSFEINNVRLAKVMLQQMANCALDKNLDKFEQAADEFEKLPMWFHDVSLVQQSVVTNRIGRESRARTAMAHAAYVHDIGHVVLDNLQFMMGPGERGTDRFFEQDSVISRFRRFATMKNCHVTLVIHPRKERDDDELGLASVFGGARATQEADNVLILQVLRAADTQRKYIQVLKNRFSGDLGPIPLQFNKDSLSFAVKRKPREKKEPARQPAEESPPAEAPA
ncbi:twinkle protein, mitochondrial-like [Pollicipes pollicipes]|uniref:twinkle protein, mitochondrial-like n=1 Tax=Pollicipes pollicipes TaxID=41117 RepID=UPI00188525DB|nr:twinkle protein, mitochondrial-like [Pollicipes pollicipes]